jgi:deoxyribose-phosphate aldolase
MNTEISLKSLTKMIDHSLLHPTLTDEATLTGCELAKKYDVATVCVKPYAAQIARDDLTGSSVGVCAVAGFPHGNSTIEIKVKEAEQAISFGATEIDLVVNIGKVLSEDRAYVSKEIKTINKAIVSQNAILKVIFENDFLEDRHIIKLAISVRFTPSHSSKHQPAMVL